MLEDAKHEGLQVGGAIADIRDYEIDGAFDVLILDRVLHMLERGNQLLVLHRVTQHVAPGGFVLITDMPSSKASFRDVFDADPAEWEFTLDKKGFLFSRKALSSDMKNASPRNSWLCGSCSPPSSKLCILSTSTIVSRPGAD